MRVPWKWAHWLCFLALAVAGCRSHHPELRPPPEPQAFAVPPENDKRYSGPHSYPNSVMERGKAPMPTVGGTGLAPMGSPGMGMGGMAGRPY